MTTTRLYEHLGLRVDGRTHRYFHLTLSEDLVSGIAAELSCEPDLLRATLLTAIRATRLEGLLTGAARGSARSAQRMQWLLLSGTSYCPQCVASGSTWRADWQLPWIFACLDHDALLAGECPECGCRPDLAPRRGTPANGAVLQRCRCGYAWKEALTGRLTPTMRRSQHILQEVLDDDQGVLWGETYDGPSTLNAWRAALVLGAWSSPGSLWATRPWLTPPRIPETMARLVGEVAPLMLASSMDEALPHFSRLMENTSKSKADLFYDRVPRTTVLSQVADGWLAGRGRASTQLDRRRRGQLVFALADLTPEQIPLLVWRCALPPTWQRDGPPHLVLRRAAVALGAARLAGASTWSDAGLAIGIAPQYADRVVRHVLSRMGPTAHTDFSEATTRVVRHLAGSRPQRAVTARPLVSNFIGLRALEGGSPCGTDCMCVASTR